MIALSFLLSIMLVNISALSQFPKIIQVPLPLQIQNITLRPDQSKRIPFYLLFTIHSAALRTDLLLTIALSPPPTLLRTVSVPSVAKFESA